MPYGIAQRNGRFVVTSPKGKTWKTTYATQEAAQKGIDYVQSRFGGSAPVPPTLVDAPAPASDDDVEVRGEEVLARFRARDEGF